MSQKSSNTITTNNKQLVVEFHINIPTLYNSIFACLKLAQVLCIPNCWEFICVSLYCVRTLQFLWSYPPTLDHTVFLPPHWQRSLSLRVIYACILCCLHIDELGGPFSNCYLLKEQYSLMKIWEMLWSYSRKLLGIILILCSFV